MKKNLERSVGGWFGGLLATFIGICSLDLAQG
jgi:hypothetical protein